MSMWELVSYLQSNVRKSCMDELSQGPVTPQIIAKRTKNHLTHISRALKELESKETEQMEKESKEEEEDRQAR